MRFQFKFPIKDIAQNKIIRKLIRAEFLLWGSWGFISPIFAIFVKEKTAEASSLLIIGVAVGVYWLVKSLLQIPVATFIDKTKGERDDFIVLFLGVLLAGVAAFSFLFVTNAGGIILVSALQGVAFGLYVPALSAMFSRHVDKKHRALEWSLDSTSIGIISAFTAFFGGTIAQLFGFDTIFVIVGFLGLLNAFLLLFLPQYMFPPKKSRGGTPLFDHTHSESLDE